MSLTGSATSTESVSVSPSRTISTTASGTTSPSPSVSPSPGYLLVDAANRRIDTGTIMLEWHAGVYGELLSRITLKQGSWAGANLLANSSSAASSSPGGPAAASVITQGSYCQIAGNAILNVSAGAAVTLCGAYRGDGGITVVSSAWGAGQHCVRPQRGDVFVWVAL